MLGSRPSRSVLSTLGIGAAAVAVFAGTAALAGAHHGTTTQHQLEIGTYNKEADKSGHVAYQSCKRQTNLGPESPGWNQLDPWTQSVILNRLRPAVRPHSPGWNQLDPWIQSAILNGLASHCTAQSRNGD